jgi:L-aminopeptidase/D-esterase-like protein
MTRLNLLTDVAGLSVGQADDAVLVSGVTVVLFDRPAVASVAVVGGGPAGRDLGCLEPDAVVPAIDAIVLSGGSGFGLDAAGGVQAWLRAHGRGFAVGNTHVPIVPSAVCFDLNNGGDKNWGRYAPYRELGWQACEDAGQGPFRIGSHGAGYGATTVDLRGGIGSASDVTTAGHTVAAIVAVNALGSTMLAGGPHFWAAPLEHGAEFGGLGLPQVGNGLASSPLTWKGGPPLSTTIACIATDAALDKAQTKRLAVAATAGLARGLRLSHARLDGDTVFAAATGRRKVAGTVEELIEIDARAADCLARAIARAIYEASPADVRWSGPQSWRQRFPGAAQAERR